jgi:hypothetical protein
MHCCRFASIILVGASAALAGEPDPLAPYRDFVAANSKLVTNSVGPVEWETFFQGKPEEKFWGKPTTRLENEATREVELSTEKVDGTTVLKFDAEKCEAAFLPVGPKVRGDVAIEFVCRSTSERLNDLSIILDGLVEGPGFQFGGYNNTRNILRGDDLEGDWKRLVDLPATTLIRRDQWHTVRLEIVKGLLRAYVDGKKLGELECGEAYRPEVERQPLFYIYDSIAHLKSITFQKAKGSEPAPANDAGKAAELKAKVTGLVGLLDHEDFKIRSGAQELLKQLGSRAFPQLRTALKDGTPEQRARAREILGLPEE